MKLLKGNKSGLTLIESLAVIGLAALVIAGALILFGNAQDSRRVTAETTNISNVLKRMEEVFAEDDLEGADVTNPDDFITAGVFNDSMKIVGTQIFHSWNNEVQITVTGPASYDLTYLQIPADEPCIDLVRSTRKVGFDEISINGTVEDITDLSVSEIITRCSEASVGANYVDVIWSMTN